MLKQYKTDLKIIAEIFLTVAKALAWCFIFTKYEWIAIVFYILVIGQFIYNYYFKKVNKLDIITFPTQNDDYSKMTFITFSIIIMLFSFIGYFALNLNIYFSITGLAIGAMIFLLGYFKSPLGWILIENNSLKAYGIQGDIDTTQLKEITIKNDKITLTDIHGENKSSNTLKLSPIYAQNIVNFIGKKIHQEITIVNQVN